MIIYRIFNIVNSKLVNLIEPLIWKMSIPKMAHYLNITDKNPHLIK